jgi:N-methylhydantoinase B
LIPPTEFDSVTLEILWSRLVSIADEQTAMILRTAFSPIVRESQDFACVVLNRHGELLAQPYQTLPAFTRAASVVTRHFMAKWPVWDEGDVAITNDPWLSTGHLHDVSIVVPVFCEGKLVAFCANIAHQADIGGRGYSADATSIFE